MRPSMVYMMYPLLSLGYCWMVSSLSERRESIH
nr:MAG TPA: hypothetical protein [Caudoviricetes sp.]